MNGSPKAEEMDVRVLSYENGTGGKGLDRHDRRACRGLMTRVVLGEDTRDQRGEV